MYRYFQIGKLLFFDNWNYEFSEIIFIYIV